MFNDQFTTQLINTLTRDIAERLGEEIINELKKQGYSSKLLKAGEVATYLGVSKSSFNQNIRTMEGFPPPIILYKKAHPLWHIKDLEDFIESLRYHHEVKYF